MGWALKKKLDLESLNLKCKKYNMIGTNSFAVDERYNVMAMNLVVMQCSDSACMKALDTIC